MRNPELLASSYNEYSNLKILCFMLSLGGSDSLKKQIKIICGIFSNLRHLIIPDGQLVLSLSARRYNLWSAGAFAEVFGFELVYKRPFPYEAYKK